MYSARPARSRTTPSKLMSNTSLELVFITRETWCPALDGKSKTAETIVNDTAADTTPPITLSPANNTAMTGRNTAITKSSITKMERIVGVSRLPKRLRSVSIFAITPDDETYVIPPRTTAPSAPQPSNKPITIPGVALKTKSITLERRFVAMLCRNSCGVYSRPKTNIRNTTPSEAPTSTNGPASVIGMMPPSPKNNPASK